MISFLRHDSRSDQLTRRRRCLPYFRFLAFGSVAKLDNEAAPDMDSLEYREKHELVLVNLECVLDEDLLLGADPQFFVIFALTKVLEFKKLLRQLIAILEKLVLVLVNPFILLKFN